MNASSAPPLYIASLLANFFEAGWSIQVLLGDMNRAQFEASRLARPEIERHLRTMSDSARALPAEVRDQMPRVDWQSWEDLGAYVPPHDEHARSLVWTALEAWLPPAGAELRRYRRRLPELWRFQL